MKLIPAIDLKDNKCVRLRKGKENDATIFNENPVKQAKFFEKQGCERIHIVDLDGAFGRPNINKKTIDIIYKVTMPVSVLDNYTRLTVKIFKRSDLDGYLPIDQFKF